MSATSYTKALIPTPYTIMGLDLKPFCIGHVLLMQHFNCSFGADEAIKVNVNQLVQDFLWGLVICSMTFEEFYNACQTNTLEVYYSKDFAVKRIKFTDWIKNWRKAILKAVHEKNANLLTRLAAFNEYIREAMEVPMFFQESEGTPKNSGSHWTLTILNVLTGELGYSQSEALNMPLAQAYQVYLKFCERNGLITIATQREQEEAKRLEAAANG